jgi:hypothetical protein
VAHRRDEWASRLGRGESREAKAGQESRERDRAIVVHTCGRRERGHGSTHKKERLKHPGKRKSKREWVVGKKGKKKMGCGLGQLKGFGPKGF